MSNQQEGSVSIFELAKRTDLPSTFKYPGSDEPHKGSLRIGYTVNCGECADWYESYQCSSKAQFVRQVKEGGWKLTRKQGWVCPTHNRRRVAP